MISDIVPQEKLQNFTVHHHESFRISYKAKLDWWHEETVTKQYRCARCWLQKRHCYCEELDRKQGRHFSYTEKCKTQLCIYYDPKEIGRSANTAHIIEELSPTITTSIICGDYDKEVALVDDMEKECMERFPSICVLYPSKDAMKLSEWIAHRESLAQQHPNSAELLERPVRLVALDGTFPAASRLAKHLKYSCSLRGFGLSMVKLDLDSGKCKSAIAGMMTQPNKEKICSFQAMVLALEQLGVDVDFCSALHQDLQEWLAHMLRTSIKLGKSTQRKSAKEVDGTPDAYLQQIMIDCHQRSKSRQPKPALPTPPVPLVHHQQQLTQHQEQQQEQQMKEQDDAGDEQGEENEDLLLCITSNS